MRSINVRYLLTFYSIGWLLSRCLSGCRQTFSNRCFSYIFLRFSRNLAQVTYVQVWKTRSSAVTERPSDAVLLNILLSHSRSFEMTLLSSVYVSPYDYSTETMSVYHSFFSDIHHQITACPPTEGRRLSRPSWLVTYRDGLPVHRRSPILVLTGSDVAQLINAPQMCPNYRRKLACCWNGHLVEAKGTQPTPSPKLSDGEMSSSMQVT